MSTTLILMGVALLGVTFCLISISLSQNRSQEPEVDGAAAESVEDQHQAALVASRDLDFDRKLGKVTDGDYASSRSALLVQAATAIEAADRAQVEDVEAEVEAEVGRARRSKPPAGRPTQTNGSVSTPTNGSGKADPRPAPVNGSGKANQNDAASASHKGHPAQQPQARFCAHCGADVRPGDRFCRGCGVRVQTGCPGCGAEFQAGDKFCRVCGTALRSSPSVLAG